MDAALYPQMAAVEDTHWWFSGRRAICERMLERMVLGDPPGNYDRLLDFTHPVTGSLFFAPAAGFLADQPQQLGTGALDIGSLKGVPQQ